MSSKSPSSSRQQTLESRVRGNPQARFGGGAVGKGSRKRDLAGGLPYLPITGTRSVQAMYRDYFPGQLDNVDVAQKTRDDGTVEVTFKRRIGTKGANVQSKPRHAAGGS